jgi:paraquat-inducible protein A
MSFSFESSAGDTLKVSGKPETIDRPTPSQLRECVDCGQFQMLPALYPGSVARCIRCQAVLRRTHHDTLGRALALNLGALVLLAISCGATLMTVSTFGMYHRADIFSGPAGLQRHGVWELSAVVLFTTVAAPLLRLGLVTYVLIGLLRREMPPGHLRTAFRWAERLRPWSMIEVFLLGVFVAYTKLSGMMHIEIGVALYSLVALMLAMVAADFMLDRYAVWEAIDRRSIPRGGIDAPTRTRASALACDACGLVSVPTTLDERPSCPRCAATLEHRKPDSVTRCRALVIASAILYVPANLLPVLTVIQLGSGSPSTILGGARELLGAGMWPLALLVFLASVAVPCLKLVGLSLLLITTKARSSWCLRDRTVLYRIVNTIGRWSMIDIFMESILIALVQFGAVVTIDPGFGAVAFAGVVILTMFAAEAFDPRLMWDAAAMN